MLRFGIVGVASTLLHYGIYLALLCWMPANIAYATGYILAFFFNFWATSRFTFRVAPSWKALIGMSGAHAVNFVLHMVLLNLFLWIGIPESWAPAPVYAIAIPVNFILVRFAFKTKP